MQDSQGWTAQGYRYGVIRKSWLTPQSETQLLYFKMFTNQALTEPEIWYKEL